MNKTKLQEWNALNNLLKYIADGLNGAMEKGYDKAHPEWFKQLQKEYEMTSKERDETYKLIFNPPHDHTT